MSLAERQLNLARCMLAGGHDAEHVRRVLEAMAELLGADVAALSIGRPGRRLRLRLTMDRPSELQVPQAPLAIEPYELLAPLRDAVLQLPAGSLHRYRDLLASAAAQKSGYFSAWREETPLTDGCATYLQLPEGELCKISFGRLAHEGQGGSLQEDGIACLDATLPFLQAWLGNLRHREMTEALCASFADRYDRYRVGALVIDQDGWVLYQNQSARAVLAQADGLSMLGARLRLDDAAELSALMDGICQHMQSPAPNGSFLAKLFPVSRRSGASLVLAVSVHRAPGQVEAGLSTVLIFDPDRPALDRRAAMQSIYALTEREADIVSAISEGMSLEDFAARSGCTVTAARSVLKRVFRKTGTARQTEIVKLMLAGPAAMVQ
ncbi:MAG: helix-turn-helix transcriptional regulator [Gammaproteobacteria bacterium]